MMLTPCGAKSSCDRKSPLLTHRMAAHCISQGFGRNICPSERPFQFFRLGSLLLAFSEIRRTGLVPGNEVGCC